jgi:hypothetical protein
MQGLGHKYLVGERWKIPTLKKKLVWDLKTPSAWCTYVVIMIIANIFFALLFETKEVGPVILPKFP